MEVPQLSETLDLRRLREVHPQFNRYRDQFPTHVLPFLWREIYYLQWLTANRPNKYLFFNSTLKSFEHLGNDAVVRLDAGHFTVVSGMFSPSKSLGSIWRERVDEWSYLPWINPDEFICKASKIRNNTVLVFLNRYHLCRLPIGEIPILEQALRSLWKKEYLSTIVWDIRPQILHALSQANIKSLKPILSQNLQLLDTSRKTKTD